MQARQAESAFSLRVGMEWPHGSGWLLVYAARWLGKARRLPTPDSLIACFVKPSGEVHVLSASEGMRLVETSEECPNFAPLPSPAAEGAARKSAQQVLRDLAARRDHSARSAANLSLLLVACLTQP
jgi:hypothetical protein